MTRFALLAAISLAVGACVDGTPYEPQKRCVQRDTAIADTAYVVTYCVELRRAGVEHDGGPRASFMPANVVETGV